MGFSPNKKEKPRRELDPKIRPDQGGMSGSKKTTWANAPKKKKSSE